MSKSLVQTSTQISTLEDAYLALSIKEYLNNSQRTEIFNDNPQLAKFYLHKCGIETGENQIWLNTNVYTEYEKEVSDLRREQGL